jgi:hypothetical protein
MARVKGNKKTPKAVDVAKFGGTEELGKAVMHGYEHDVASVEVKSQTRLEEDKGEGNATVIRCFTFGMNPEAFATVQPTRQELFNSHLHGIEIALFADGLKIFDGVAPRMTFDVDKKQYSIFVAARPSKGFLLQDNPQTLSEIING